MSGETVDTATFGHSADPQLSSLFFTLLPAEIRNLIYHECWKNASTRQHIFTRESSDGEGGDKEWVHVPCLIAPDAEDVRFARFRDTRPVSDENMLWGKRLRSEWCLHWSCEEQVEEYARHENKVQQVLLRRTGARENNGNHESEPRSHPAQEERVHSPLPKSGFLDILRTCKRM